MSCKCNNDGGCFIFILVVCLSISSCSAFARIDKKLERLEQFIQNRNERDK